MERVKETRMYMPVSTGENQDNFGTSVGVGGGPILLLRWTSLILRPCADTVASDCEIIVDVIDGWGRK
jgi:hypothetical protein